MTGALDGILVVALEQAVAAPLCSCRLADAGARVIKIERPEGDFARYYDAATAAGSSYFVWLNRGKESMVLDLSRDDARRELAALIDRADILVQNLKPGALERLGFGIDRLRADRPELICCSISGYGADGPLASRKAYDLLVQAESGLASITGNADEPARVGISVVDIATGATAHAAILEALIAWTRTGRGADIRIAMFDVMADWLAVPLLNAEAGNPPARVGLAHPSIAPYGVFSAAGGEQLLISIQSEREWRLFCRDVLGDFTIADDPRFASNVARVTHRAETDALVANRLFQFDAPALAERLGGLDIAFAQLNDMAALSRHPHLRRVTVETSAGLIAIPATAAIFDATPRSHRPVPALGEHSDSIRAQLAVTRG
jgi:formyl-CoA transferase